MRKKGANQISYELLVDNNNFTLGVESQTVPTLLLSDKTMNLAA